jgi:hypothetical protein
MEPQILVVWAALECAKDRGLVRSIWAHDGSDGMGEIDLKAGLKVPHQRKPNMSNVRLQLSGREQLF